MFDSLQFRIVEWWGSSSGAGLVLIVAGLGCLLALYLFMKICPSPQPSPHGGKGERGQIFMLFKA
jgi:hypothetical protein